MNPIAIILFKLLSRVVQRKLEKLGVEAVKEMAKGVNNKDNKPLKVYNQIKGER